MKYRTPPRAIDALTVAIWFGILAGIGDALFVYFDITFNRRGIQYLPLSLWTIDILAWSAVSALAALPFAMMPRARRLAPAAAVLAGPAMVVLIRLIALKRQFWPATSKSLFLAFWFGAAIILALAVAFVFRRLTRVPRTLIAATSAFIAASLLPVLIPTTSRPDRDPVAAGGRNIVLIILDTVRYDISDAAHVPNLAAFASRGVVFDNAISPSPWTIPAHVAMLAGIPTNRLTIDFDHQSLSGQETLATVLQRRGYHTRAVFANYTLTPGTGLARGFDRFEYPRRYVDFGRTAVGALLRETAAFDGYYRWLAPEVTRRAHQFLATATSPYFLALNYVDPHRPGDATTQKPGHSTSAATRRFSMQ